MRLLVTLLLAIIIPCFVVPSLFAQAQFIPLGHTPGAPLLSPDGDYVVFVTPDLTGVQIWTDTGGVQQLLPDVGGVYGIAADARAVIGSVGGSEGYIWTPTSGKQMIPPPAGFTNVVPQAISDSGDVVVGYGFTSTGETQGFVWTVGGTPVGVGFLPESIGEWPYSWMTAVSGDGSTRAGYAKDANRYNQTVIYEAGNLQKLPHLSDPGSGPSYPNAANEDGSVLVGRTTLSGVQHATIWNNGSVMDAHSGSGYDASTLYDVTADGAIAVGWANNTGQLTQATIWDQTNGLRSLKSFLESEYGLDLTGWELRYARGISADGRVISGWGEHDGTQEMWIVRVEPEVVIPWVNAGGGLYADSANWLDGIPPTETQSALFDSSYFNSSPVAAAVAASAAVVNITFDAIQNNRGLKINRGQVAFDLQQHSFGLRSLEIGAVVDSANESQLTVFNGALGVTYATFTDGVTVGTDETAGTLILDVDGSLEIAGGGDTALTLVVGEGPCQFPESSGVFCGNVLIQNGGKLYGGNAIIGLFGGTGSVVIEGASSQWLEATSIDLGAFSGIGELTLRHEAELTTNTLTMGLADTSSFGFCLLDGDVSVVVDTLIIGDDGNGELILTNTDAAEAGPAVFLGNHAVLGRESGSAGYIDIEVAGFFGSIGDATIIIGQQGHAEVSISGGGQLISDEIMLASDEGSTASLTVRGDSSRCFATDLVIGFSGDTATAIVDSGATVEVEAVLYVGGLDNENSMVVAGPGTEVTVGIDTLPPNVDTSLTAVGVGFGVLDILNGAVFRSYGDLTVGLFQGGQGEIVVSGTDSRLEVADSLVAGASGDGGLVIDSGGTLLTGTVVVAEDSSATGSVLIMGDSSLWRNDSDVRIGLDGVGLVRLRDGGTLSNDFGTVHIGRLGSLDASDGVFSTQTLAADSGGTYIDSLGTINVGGVPVPSPVRITAAANSVKHIDTLLIAAGATFDVAEILFSEGGYLGVGGAFAFPLTNGGGLNPGGPVGITGTMVLDSAYEQTSVGTLFIELADSLPGGFDQLIVNGTATLAGTLDISLVDNFLPQVGQTFEVIRADTIFGAFESTVTSEGLEVTLDYSDSALTATVTVVTDVADDNSPGELPRDFSLQQNYPNPFNPSTTIEFSLPAASQVELTILNIAGQHVRTLVNTRLPAGEHAIIWNGRTDNRVPAASGVYFYRLVTEDASQSRKMILLK